MKLYLVQHGEACAKEVDPERPLTEQGQADVERVAAFLKQANVNVERVLHSGKRRAQQTAECLAKVIVPDSDLETSAVINPNDDPNALDWPSACGHRDTLLVSHLPFLSKLVSHLSTGDENQLMTAYTPGSVVCLELIEDTHWQINWMIRPELLVRVR